MPLAPSTASAPQPSGRQRRASSRTFSARCSAGSVRSVGTVAKTSAVTGGWISISDAWEIEPIGFQDLLIDCYPDSALMPIRPEPESESEKREEALHA